MNQPILIPIIGKESGDRWLLTGYWDGKKNVDGDWSYEFRIGINFYKMVVPFGWNKLDGASVPRWLQSIVRMGGREMPDEAWLPHDFIYFHKGAMPSQSLFIKSNGGFSEIKKVDKEFADRMLYNELSSKRHGLADFKPIVAYWGVWAAFWKKF